MDRTQGLKIHAVNIKLQSGALLTQLSPRLIEDHTLYTLSEGCGHTLFYDVKPDVGEIELDFVSVWLSMTIIGSSIMLIYSL